jgi:hypothetical protein
VYLGASPNYLKTRENKPGMKNTNIRINRVKAKLIYSPVCFPPNLKLILDVSPTIQTKIGQNQFLKIDAPCCLSISHKKKKTEKKYIKLIRIYIFFSLVITIFIKYAK